VVRCVVITSNVVFLTQWGWGFGRIWIFKKIYIIEARYVNESDEFSSWKIMHLLFAFAVVWLKYVCKLYTQC
jgi:hypothetical protein